MEVKMNYDPKTNKFPYTEDTAAHYLKVKKNDGSVFDAGYPFLDGSRPFRFKCAMVRALLVTFVFPVARIRLGLKVEGRENLKKHREVIKKGVISCSNHVHMWDYLAIMSAVSPIRTNVITWAPNVRGENGKMMRSVGAIPIPDEGGSATAAFIRAVKKRLSDGGWVQIYAEGSMWEYYKPIRPFKRGIGFFACRTDHPVIPMAFTYRKPGFIREKVFGQIACFTLHIGEPVFPDKSLPPAERERDMIVKCHDAVCRLSGVEPEDNIYPPVYDNSKRIDYYTTEYGIGYKGSH